VLRGGVFWDRPSAVARGRSTQSLGSLTADGDSRQAARGKLHDRGRRGSGVGLGLWSWVRVRVRVGLSPTADGGRGQAARGELHDGGGGGGVAAQAGRHVAGLARGRALRERALRHGVQLRAECPQVAVDVPPAARAGRSPAADGGCGSEPRPGQPRRDVHVAVAALQELLFQLPGPELSVHLRMRLGSHVLRPGRKRHERGKVFPLAGAGYLRGVFAANLARRRVWLIHLNVN
jgi:hypothetical protein